MDLLTSASLLGDAVNAQVLAALRDAGFDGTRIGHGYVVQRLLEEPSSITDIAGALGVTPQAISKAVGELERGGYVSRSVDSRDARRHLVALTPRGREMVEAARSARAGLLADVSQAVGPDALAAATAVLHEALRVSGVLEAARRRLAGPAEEAEV